MPGVTWAKNLLLGKELTQKEMEDIPYPRLELHTHVMYKTIEMGSIVGVVIGSVASLIKKKPFVLTALKGGVNGAAVGVVMGPIMTEGMLQAKKATPQSVWDRCYRLRYNTGQVRTDRFATFCGLTGATVMGMMGSGPLRGAVVGIVSGTLAAGVIGNALSVPSKPKPQPAAPAADAAAPAQPPAPQKK